MRSVHCYPKAQLAGDQWILTVKVTDRDTGEAIRPVHTETAGVVAEIPVSLLKIVWDMQIDDGNDLQFVVDALLSDDIQPGGQFETVWGNWRDIAEGILAGLTSPYTNIDFREGWSKPNTNSMRQDANRALVTQRGWLIDVGSIHQHEGDETNTDL